MTVRTSAGTTLKVSAATPATFDTTGYNALTMTLNRAIASINALVAGTNAVLEVVGLPLLSQMDQVVLPRLENRFAGSTGRMADAVRGEFTTAFHDAEGMLDAFSERWRQNTLDAARTRIAARAAEIRGDRSDRAGSRGRDSASDEAERALQAARDYAAALVMETAKIGRTAIEIKRLEVAMAALRAPTDESRIAIIQAGQAWEDATRAQNAAEFVRSTVTPLELQISLLGQSAKAQALATLEAEREQIVLERGVEAWNRYHAARAALIEHDFGLAQQQQYLESLQEMASLTQQAAQGMSDAFGTVGAAIGGVAAEFARYAAQQTAAAPANKAGESFTGAISVAGSITATGDVTAYSDASLKTDVATIAGALDLIRRMRGVRYQRLDTGAAGIGVIAQELREVTPELIAENPDGLLSVAYGNLVGVLIEAVKELAARVETLETRP